MPPLRDGVNRSRVKSSLFQYLGKHSQKQLCTLEASDRVFDDRNISRDPGEVHDYGDYGCRDK